MKRDKGLDVVRGGAILLVVFAHAIQSCTNMAPTDYLQKIILTFEMPLMMMISGYTVCFSIPIRSIRSFTITKVWRILVPYIMWEQIHYLIIALKSRDYSLGEQIQSVFISQFWFLRILFIIYLVFIGAVVCYRLAKKYLNEVMSVGISCIYFLAVSFVLGSFYGMEYLRSYSICFGGGIAFYYFRKGTKPKWVNMFCLLGFVVFLGEVLLFGRLTGVMESIIDKSMAFSGSVAFVTVMYFLSRLFDNDIISSFGKNTLPIYAIHWCLLFNPNLLFNGEIILRLCSGRRYVAALVLSVIWLLVCYFVIFIIHKSKVGTRLLLGEKI